MSECGGRLLSDNGTGRGGIWRFGSLVFTGLQIGAEIASGTFRIIVLLLITARMHIISLNGKNPSRPARL